MKISLISFTANGFRTEKRLVSILKKKKDEPCPYVMGKYAMQAAAKDHEISFMPVREGELSDWAGERFTDSEALIFVGASGIAVRAISGHVKNKKTDPAVLVVDESAAFVIPLLSGHLGGANELAVYLAEEMSAIPVVTTATDVNGRFAVDMFAKRNGLSIDNMKLAKEISADILAGRPVGFSAEFPLKGRIPVGLFCDRICSHNIRITIHKRKDPEKETQNVLRLIPRCVALGIGCRRGTPAETIRRVAERALKEEGLDIRSVCAVASIDLKSGEPGLCELTRELEVPFLTYTKEELNRVPGEYTESAFVKKTTGVGNVCERAAMAACKEAAAEARLIIKKYAEDGVTTAAALFEPELEWKL